MRLGWQRVDFMLGWWRFDRRLGWQKVDFKLGWWRVDRRLGWWRVDRRRLDRSDDWLARSSNDTGQASTRAEERLALQSGAHLDLATPGAHPGAKHWFYLI